MRVSILTFCCYLAGTMLFISGCDLGGGGDENKPVQTENNKTDNPIGHLQKHRYGPHDGAFFYLGKDEYNAELALNDKTKLIDFYLYGQDLMTPVSIDAKSVTLIMKINGKLVQLELPAKPLEGETGGKSTHFAAAAPPDVAEHLPIIEDLEGELRVVIDGELLSSEIERHLHRTKDRKKTDHKADAQNHADRKDADHKNGDSKKKVNETGASKDNGAP